MDALGVGIDHCEVSRIADALARWGDRFRDRIFTPGEIAYCLKFRSPDLHFAARFAAKEALGKAMGTGVWRRGVNWNEIEVVHAATGQPQIRLHGRTRTTADQLGFTSFLLAITHTEELGSAVVIAGR